MSLNRFKRNDSKAEHIFDGEIRKPRLVKSIAKIQIDKEVNSRKINKDDIQMASGQVKVKPMVQPKPFTCNTGARKINKDDIQIACQGVRVKPSVSPKTFKCNVGARKITKDEIQIACGEVKVKPLVSPKPSKSKPNVVVVKGSASTTNEMLSKQRLYSVGDGSGV